MNLSMKRSNPEHYETEWPNRMNGNTKNYASGIYFYQLISDDIISIKSMILLK